MNKFVAKIVDDPEGHGFRVRSNAGDHVEIVDDNGFAGLDPTSEDILEAYIADVGHAPQTREEVLAFGSLVLRTAWYHQEIFTEAVEEMELFGLETEEHLLIGGALSLDTLHSDQVYPFLSEVRCYSSREDLVR